MTHSRVVDIVFDHYADALRTAPRGRLTRVIVGSYLGGVALTAGGLVLAGVRIGRKIA